MRIIEVLKNNKGGENYHYIQYKKPYRSTEVFIEWINEKICESKKILDIACGGGKSILFGKKISRNKF